MKISIIGAGNVGATLAERVLMQNLSDVVLVDIAGDMAKGKSLDLLDSSPVMGYEKNIKGSGEYKDTENSDIVVITAGLPRKPGMSREDLIEKNTSIIKNVIENIKKTSPNAILVIVTNPLDIMTYVAYKEFGCSKDKILGMAGSLDTARYKALLKEETGIPYEKIEAYVLGSHGDTMVPLLSKTKLDKKPLNNVMSKEKIDALIERTKKRGGEIVSLLKTGSAYFSPSAACFEILKAIVKDEKKIIPCSCILKGEYGIKDCAIGVPAKIGKKGILEVVKWELPPNELDALKKSAQVAKDALNKMGVVHAGS